MVLGRQPAWLARGSCGEGFLLNQNICERVPHIEPNVHADLAASVSQSLGSPNKISGFRLRNLEKNNTEAHKRPKPQPNRVHTPLTNDLHPGDLYIAYSEATFCLNEDFPACVQYWADPLVSRAFVRWLCAHRGFSWFFCFLFPVCSLFPLQFSRFLQWFSPVFCFFVLFFHRCSSFFHGFHWFFLSFLLSFFSGFHWFYLLFFLCLFSLFPSCLSLVFFSLCFFLLFLWFSSSFLSFLFYSSTHVYIFRTYLYIFYVH
jgi:hypothetical protein